MALVFTCCHPALAAEARAALALEMNAADRAFLERRLGDVRNEPQE